MNNKFVGKLSAVHHRHIHLACAATVVAGVCALLSTNEADARRGQYMIPPPPPTPVMAVPPPPVMLPYDAAYSNYKAPATPATAIRLAPPAVTPPHAVRSNPNFTGLSLSTAKVKGYGKPRTPYTSNTGPGAALASASVNGPAMNTWFDSSLRWYAGHAQASSYYNSLANQAPHFRPEAPGSMPQPMADTGYYEPPTPQTRPAHKVSKHRRYKRVVAYR